MATPQQTDTAPEPGGTKADDIAHDNPDRFWVEARYQGGCAMCGRGGRLNWEAHHVLYAQECVRAGAPEHAPRNALRVCAKGIQTCHERHHGGTEMGRILLTALRQENIDFAADWISPGRAYNFLMRHYGGRDPRVDALLDRA